MDLAAYAIEAKVEESHWWFVGRRTLFSRIIGRMRLPADAAVLDLGTSTGTNLRMLRDLRMTNVVGLDLSDEAIRFCAAKGFGTVRKGDITAIPFADASFDLVLATDVIEHVDDDAKALREIRRVLRPGGKAIVTVPAFKALWGPQDVLALHKRRYRMKPLVREAEAAGLRIASRFHFNYLLFAPIYLARRLLSAVPNRVRSENEINGPLLNRILGAVFSFDVWSAPVLRPPFGVSILLVVEAAR